MTYRDATPSDTAALVALVQSAYRGEASRKGWTTEAHLLEGQRTDAASMAGTKGMLVLEEAGAITACCQLELKGDHAYFGTFAVDPQRQGQGTGDALLAEAERRATEAGVTAVEMTVIAQRTELIAWYGRRGYAPTGETRPFPYGDERFGTPLRDDLEFVVLRKQL